MTTIARMHNKIGKTVRVQDGNGNDMIGTVMSVGQANDGTGRVGYWVRVGRDMWWCKTVRIAAK